MNERDRELYFTILLESARKGITLRYGQFDRVTSLPDWTRIPDTDDEDADDPYKLKFIGRDHFLKLFSPFAGPFYHAAARTIQELGRMNNLSVPILSPIYAQHGALFFPKGIDVGKVPWQFLPARDRQMIATVVKENGLEPFEDVKINDVSLVVVDGKTYLVDPFDDSSPSIGNYLTQRRREL